MGTTVEPELSKSGQTKEDTDPISQVVKDISTGLEEQEARVKTMLTRLDSLQTEMETRVASIQREQDQQSFVIMIPKSRQVKILD